MLWWLLAATSIPLHLLYNSAVFTTLYNRDYELLVLTNDFADFQDHVNCSSVAKDAISSLSPTTSYITDSSCEAVKNDWKQFERLSKRACLQAYAPAVVTDRARVLLISSRNTTRRSEVSYVLDEFLVSVRIDQYPTTTSHWICPAPSEKVNDRCNLKKAASDVSSKFMADYDVQYCLSQRIEEHCTLQFCPTILVIVIICNFFKTGIMAYIARRRDWEPLATLGDAVASFLDKPDPSTKGMSSASRKMIEDAKYLRYFPVTTIDPERQQKEVYWNIAAKAWAPENRRWFKAASRPRWIACNAMLVKSSYCGW